MSKNPYLPLYTGDWKKDPALTRCAPATRGIWIDLLCDMHELDRCGELRGTTEELARASRCSTEEFLHALTDLQAKGAADVEQRNGTVLIRNRRMFAESRKRKLAAERQMRFRRKDGNSESNADVPLENDNDICALFDRFWEEYPRIRRQSKGDAREAFAKALTKTDFATILAAVKAYAESDAGRGKYCKGPTPWLNQECWSDDRAAWRDLDGRKPVGEREYRQVTITVFRAHKDAGDFLGGPKRDLQKTGNGYRVHGQLKTGRKIESHTDPNWNPE